MFEQMVKEAYEEVEVYRNKLNGRKLEWKNFDKDFSELPLLEKNDILGHEGDMIPPRYIMDFYNEELLDTHTSGSTGKCLEVYWRAEDAKKSMYPLWFYRRKYYGIEPWDKKCQFYTVGQNENEDEDGKRYVRNGLDFSKANLTEERLVDIYKEMCSYEPAWLLLQPCIAELLCQVKEMHHLPKIETLRYIEMTGEMLHKNLRNRIKECFEVPIANQYGMNEMNSIAYECPNGNLHCIEQNVYVEILDKNGRRRLDGIDGDIYVTTKNNKVMPLIRYRTGDRGKLLPNTCTCGMKGKILELQEGRENDWIQMKNGERRTAYIFVRVIEIVNEITDNAIKQYQILQKEYDQFEVKLVCRSWNEEMKQLFVRLLQEEIPYAQVEFQREDNLFPEGTGKRRFFRNLIK